MDLWIRTQCDEGIVKVNNVFINDCKDKIVTFIGDDTIILGTYKTNKRTIEVLDEIQYFLQWINNPIAQAQRNFKNVYIMPKE